MGGPRAVLRWYCLSLRGRETSGLGLLSGFGLSPLVPDVLVGKIHPSEKDAQTKAGRGRKEKPERGIAGDERCVSVIGVVWFNMSASSKERGGTGASRS